MSHTAVENARRARAGVFVLESYRIFKQANGETGYADEPAEDLLSDVLTDLRHAADTLEVDFTRAVRVSRDHYAAELNQEEDDAAEMLEDAYAASNAVNPRLPAFPPAGVVTVEADATDEGYLLQPVGYVEITAALQVLGVAADSYEFLAPPQFTELGLYNVGIRAEDQDYVLKLWVVPTIKEGQ